MWSEPIRTQGDSVATSARRKRRIERVPFWLKWPSCLKRSSRDIPRVVGPFRGTALLSEAPFLLLQGARFFHAFHSMDANMATIPIGSTRVYIHPAMALWTPKGDSTLSLSRRILSLHVRQLMKVTAKHFTATLLILLHRLP